jgi:hypothetical protein
MKLGEPLADLLTYKLQKIFGGDVKVVVIHDHLDIQCPSDMEDDVIKVVSKFIKQEVKEYCERFPQQ